MALDSCATLCHTAQPDGLGSTVPTLTQPKDTLDPLALLIAPSDALASHAAEAGVRPRPARNAAHAPPILRITNRLLI
jgi:hypothetical protein